MLYKIHVLYGVNNRLYKIHVLYVVNNRLYKIHNLPLSPVIRVFIHSAVLPLSVRQVAAPSI